jgi:nucleotide-binding universal stress UspA family protein
MARAVTQVREIAPDITVHTDAVLGQPVPNLLAAAKLADLVVLGNRGRGGFASLMLGSVSQRVATHAECPVVVVRGRRDIADGPVVVGVDGSTSSLEALEHAFQEAATHEADLVAVLAYAPASPPWGEGVEPIVIDTKQRDAEDHAALTEWLAPLQEKFPEVKAEALVAHGSAGAVLVGLSQTAQLVVVGSRGHGGLTGTVIGSVGLQLLHHAESPVMISRPASAA